MKKILNNYRLKWNNLDLIPLIIGGMGVEISTAELALEIARLGGIGHISDALITDLSDRKFNTQFVNKKKNIHKDSLNSMDKSNIHFDMDDIYQATHLYVKDVMDKKVGDGMIFINCMEKLTMNNSRDTLSSRLNAALDAGIDGITLSAGLHLNSLGLIHDNPRFNHIKLGVVVSSSRALNLFIQKAKRYNRLPDFVVIEGPLAGGHLGFGIDSWQDSNLEDIFREVQEYCTTNSIDTKLIAAGGIFTGQDAAHYLELGADAVQVATRFTIAQECGLPDKVKQKYIKATIDDIEVNLTSPTGYPMRMLKESPSIGGRMKPNCENLGYLLDRGKCAYIEEYEKVKHEYETNHTPFVVKNKTCLCTQMQLFQCYTCGHYTYRLKDTTYQLEDGSYYLPTAEEIFNDYLFN